MIYLLDTNIVSYLVRTQDASLIDVFEQKSKTSIIGISSITAAEIAYGLKKKNSPKLKQAVESFLKPLVTYSFDQKAAFIYGDVRSLLESQGNVIGSYDMLIAAHAMSLQATLITNNMREFERVTNLQVENWVSSN